MAAPLQWSSDAGAGGGGGGGLDGEDGIAEGRERPPWTGRGDVVVVAGVDSGCGDAQKASLRVPSSAASGGERWIGSWLTETAEEEEGFLVRGSFSGFKLWPFTDSLLE